MPNFLLRLQEACLALNWPMLLVPGVILTFLGLFLWLGGLRYAGFVLCIVGALLGATLGIAISPMVSLHPALTIIGAAAIICILAYILKRPVMYLMAAMIAAILCGGAYMTYSMSTETWEKMISEIHHQVRANPEQAEDNASNASQANLLQKIVQAQLAEQDDPEKASSQKTAIARLNAILAEIQFSANHNRTTLLIWIILGTLAGLCIAFILRKIIMAICCSIVGATSVCLGVMAILFAKKAAVFSGLAKHPKALPIIFLGMLGFGVVCQLLLARPAKVTESEPEQKE